VLQEVIAQPRREPNGDASLPNPGPHESLSEEPLPKEVIDYDNGLPLLAEPGMDRPRQTPDPIRRAMQEGWGNAASINAPAPDSVVEHHPAQPAGEEASAAVPKTTVGTPAPESPATGVGNVLPNSTTLNLEGKSGSGNSAGQTQAVGPKQLATGGPRPAAEPSKAAAPKSSDQQSSKPVAGQREYQQALVTTNPEAARVLLWRATALGNSDAQVRLADMYIYGHGVPQNCDQGLVLLRSAAQKANAQARGKLGALYATGKCVPQDRVQAYRWLTLALNDDQCSDWTEKNREMVWRQMSPKERSRAATAAR
jgi:hypothetical protein